MDVAKLVQGIDATKHFCNVEAGVTVMEYTGIIEQRSKISAGHVFLGEIGVSFLFQRLIVWRLVYHSKINALFVLKCVQ